MIIRRTILCVRFYISYYILFVLFSRSIGSDNVKLNKCVLNSQDSQCRTDLIILYKYIIMVIVLLIADDKNRSRSEADPIIPTPPEVKEHAARAIARAAKNGNVQVFIFFVKF